MLENPRIADRPAGDPDHIDAGFADIRTASSAVKTSPLPRIVFDRISLLQLGEETASWHEPIYFCSTVRP